VKSKSIGKTTFIDLTEASDNTYSDGEIEDKLLELFKKPSPDIQSFIAENSSWATTYHLSAARINLLSWYDFKKNSSVLEVGAGCGAITGLLADRCGEVSALELSPRRAKINANRNKRHQNLTVIAGNLENFQNYSTQKYDYVVCIGVLEYAGRFISGDRPFKDFLSMLRKHLKPDGVLVLAIENKLGLKYFSGSGEDHVRRPMEGIEGYPHYDGIKTFGKLELSRLLKEADFHATNFYYPVPDYKLPHTIYSDNYLPGVHTAAIPSASYPTPNPDQPREQIFREQLAVRSIANNGLFGDLANSFLVFCTPSPELKQDIVYAHCSINRKPAYQVITRIVNHGGFEVEKLSLTGAASAHVLGLKEKQSDLDRALRGFDSDLKVNKVISTAKNIGRASLEYVHGVNLQDLAIEHIISGDTQRALDVLDAFVNIVDSFPNISLIPADQPGFKDIMGDNYKTLTKCMSPGVVDLNFDNIIYEQASSTYSLIDYEWMFSFAIPKKFIISRAFLYFFRRHHQIIRATTSPERQSIELGENLLVPSVIYERFKEYFTNIYEPDKAEACFQRYVFGYTPSRSRLYRQKITHNTEMPDNTIESYRSALARIADYEGAGKYLGQQQVEIERLQTELGKIVNSRSWKLLERANRTRNVIRNSISSESS